MRHENDCCKAEEQDGFFDVFAAVMELVEMDAAWVVEGGGVNGSAGGDAIALHGRNDDELRVRSAGQHEHNQDHRSHDGTRLVDSPGWGEGQQGQDDDTGDHAHAMENAQQLANDAARRVSVTDESAEGDGGNDGKKISAPSQTTSAR